MMRNESSSEKKAGTSIESESGHLLTVKPAFEERYRSLLGQRYDEFIETSVRFLRKSVRINTLKMPVQNVKASLESQGWLLSQVPWCRSGFWLSHQAGRLDIGNTLEHALGYLYVQEAASMLPPEAMSLEEHQIVLDLCAAPGSKSTQIAQLLNGTGMVVCNDFTGERLRPLGLNVQRVGARNAVITRSDGRRFFGFGEVFDRVLVDAPCSGTGAIRKSLSTLLMWNPNAVRRLAWLQGKLLDAGYSCLKPGSVLVYSTCTLEPEEDEGVVSEFLARHDEAELLPIDLEVKRSQPVKGFAGKEYDERVRHCLRIWPQDNDTEGFFVAKFSRP